ncbi:LLM class flavin-dependent oxidoreductase [Mesorhizobium sp. M0923]|uniref:LLM class flavin-dependent oxidoreductase n=1 Tax=Mesorhizobium sp. M0923 TaxID=2957028 RepID=UPI00333851E4
MSYLLSLLDKSPVPEGSNATEALSRTVALAQKAEQLGYNRYWVAEHHSSPGLASSAPEVVVASLLANTSHIRIGSGGVMLQHYAPYKVAEVFNVLSALAPGRVDLGVGKAPGGLPLSTKALQAGRGADVKRDFADQLAELDSFLVGTLPEGHPLAGVAATPVPPAPPERILLGASDNSAALAVRHGWQFCFAAHLNGDLAKVQSAFEVYEKSTGRVPLLALFAFVAETTEAAERQVSELRVFKVHLATGQSVNLPSLEAAAEFARQAGVSEYRVEENRPSVIAGTPDHVRRELDRLHQRFGVKEFVIDTPVAGYAERLASIELLVGAYQSAAA